MILLLHTIQGHENTRDAVIHHWFQKAARGNLLTQIIIPCGGPTEQLQIFSCVTVVIVASIIWGQLLTSVTCTTEDEFSEIFSVWLKTESGLHLSDPVEELSLPLLLLWLFHTPREHFTQPWEKYSPKSGSEREPVHITLLIYTLYHNLTQTVFKAFFLKRWSDQIKLQGLSILREP